MAETSVFKNIIFEKEQKPELLTSWNTVLQGTRNEIDINKSVLNIIKLAQNEVATVVQTTKEKVQDTLNECIIKLDEIDTQMQCNLNKKKDEIGIEIGKAFTETTGKRVNAVKPVITVQPNQREKESSPTEELSVTDSFNKGLIPIQSNDDTNNELRAISTGDIESTDDGMETKQSQNDVAVLNIQNSPIITMQRTHNELTEIRTTMNELKIPTEQNILTQHLPNHTDISKANITNTIGECGFKFRQTHDNTMSEGLVEKNAKQMKSVGALILPQHFGTIFRVGIRYGMTAAHVISRDRNMPADSIATLLLHSRVRFDDKSTDFRLKRDICFIDYDLDIAVLEFDDRQALPDPLTLFMPVDYRPITKVVITGFGHPTKDGKYLDFKVEVVKREHIPEGEIKDFLMMNQKEIEQICEAKNIPTESFIKGYEGIDDQKNLLFHTFLERGASGAPVSLCSHPELVIGVFTCGFPRIFYDFKAEMINGFPIAYTFEAATVTKSIYQEMMMRNETLAKEIFPEWK